MKAILIMSLKLMAVFRSGRRRCGIPSASRSAGPRYCVEDNEACRTTARESRSSFFFEGITGWIPISTSISSIQLARSPLSPAAREPGLPLRSSVRRQSRSTTPPGWSSREPARPKARRAAGIPRHRRPGGFSRRNRPASGLTQDRPAPRDPFFPPPAAQRAARTTVPSEFHLSKWL